MSLIFKHSIKLISLWTTFEETTFNKKIKSVKPGELISINKKEM